jgi:hypothetical protein
MIATETYDQILYFLVFFKFIFVIVYSINLFGLLFNQNIYKKTLKLTILLENIFVLLMGFVLLYRFSKDTIQVKVEERILMWTLTFVMVLNGFIKIFEIDWL